MEQQKKELPQKARCSFVCWHIIYTSASVVAFIFLLRRKMQFRPIKSMLLPFYFDFKTASFRDSYFNKFPVFPSAQPRPDFHINNDLREKYTKIYFSASLQKIINFASEIFDIFIFVPSLHFQSRMGSVLPSTRKKKNCFQKKEIE